MRIFRNMIYHKPENNGKECIMKKITAVMCVRNEARYLPGFLRHIERYVDSICAVDDGSVDSTKDMLRANRKVEAILENPIRTGKTYDERGNREKAIGLAYDKGADWVLCCDPDERFERRFLKELRHIVEGDQKKLYALHFRELGGARHFRVDGIWGEKMKCILFPLAEKMSFQFPFQYHTPWHYRELDDSRETLPFNLYHLKMIAAEERAKRAALYNELDPNLEIQPIGYDYLVDESGLRLSKIRFRERYDYRTLPKDLLRCI